MVYAYCSTSGLPRTEEKGLELEFVFHPRSIAVVGASAEPEKQGYRYLNLLQNFGFKGSIYAVNPKGGEILGIKAYPRDRDIPYLVDYVISTIPAAGLAQLLDDCIFKGVKVAQLYTARLSETGKRELISQEKELVQRARKAGIRIIGPNCMGLYYPREGLSFRTNFPKESGSVAFISQSAGHTAEIVYRSSLRGVRFSKVINYGNASDLNETDFIYYFLHDPETQIIAAYIEGVRGERRFLRVLSEADGVKPVLIFKGGRTEAGGRATASHTGSLAGSRPIWDTLCRQNRVVPAHSAEELVDLMVTFLFLAAPKGRSVGILGGGGGGSVATADECAEAKLEVPALPAAFVAELKRIAPDEWDILGNPVDLSVVAAGKGGYAPLQGIIRFLIRSPEFHLNILDMGAEWLLERPEGGQVIHQILDAVIENSKEVLKPIAVILRPGDAPEEWRWRIVGELQQRCLEAGLAIYPSVGQAARALSKFVDYHHL